MPTLRTFAPDTSSTTILGAIAEDGACILEGAMTGDQSARFEGEMRSYIEGSVKGQDEFTGFSTTRTGALVARSPAAREMLTNAKVLELANQFLQPYCERIQVHLTQVIRLLPGQGKQFLHRDRLAWGLSLPRDMEPQFNTIWAQTDFTEENGATQVVPGSHKWDWEREPKHEEVTQAVMPKGSVLLYTGSVIHGGGENRSQSERVGINLTYCLGMVAARREPVSFLSTRDRSNPRTRAARTLRICDGVLCAWLF